MCIRDRSNYSQRIKEREWKRKEKNKENYVVKERKFEGSINTNKIRSHDSKLFTAFVHAVG